MRIGVKRITINNQPLQVLQASVEYKPSGRALTALVDETTGNAMGYTQELSVGTIKGKFSMLKTTDENALRSIEGGTMILELIDGKTIVSNNTYQVSDNAVSLSDGTLELEFNGDVKVK